MNIKIHLYVISRNDSTRFFSCDNYAVFVTLKVQKMQSGWGGVPDPDGPYPDIRAGGRLASSPGPVFYKLRGRKTGPGRVLARMR